MALRFMTGLAVGGTLPVDYAMMAEFLPARQRGRWLVALEGFWAVGTIAVALAAWAASSAAWKIHGAGSLRQAAPALIGIWLHFWVPESPMYLLRTGQGSEAERSWTGSWWPTDGRHSRQSSSPTRPANRETPVASSRGTSRGATLILTVWLLVSAAYYGVFVWLPAHLAGSGLGFVRGYGFLVLVALAQLPGYALAAWGVERLGPSSDPDRLPDTECDGLSPVHRGVKRDDGGRSDADEFALLGSWGALYALTPELYPTHARATGMGAAGAVARFGGLLAPTVMAPIVAASFGAAVSLFAALLLLGELFHLGHRRRDTRSAFGLEQSYVEERFQRSNGASHRNGALDRNIGQQGTSCAPDFVKASNRLWDGGADGDGAVEFLNAIRQWQLSLACQKMLDTRQHSVSELDCAAFVSCNRKFRGLPPLASTWLKGCLSEMI